MKSRNARSASPLFTVIIPCKNRGKYLEHTLRTCVNQNYERLEIIVSDDGSVDNTREVVEEAVRNDARVQYVSPGAEGGMRNNFEYALRQVKPGFVLALGGDDGLLPNGIDRMWEILRDTGMELLAWPAPVFTYPGVRGPKGQMTIYRQNKLKIVDSRQFLCRQAKNLHYLSDVESPMFYVKGVASTALVDRVRDRSPDGRFYSCPTPDGYSGIVLAGEVVRYAFSGRPYAIYGLSPESQGVAFLSDSEDAKRESLEFFSNLSSKAMHAELAGQPYSPLITLMTADYLLTAKDLPGWPGTFPEIDYRQMLINAIKELAHGLHGSSRICRELAILDNIAEKHGLRNFFRASVRLAKRRRRREHFEGTGITANRFLLDAGLHNIHNICDAANATQLLYSIYSDLQMSSLLSIVFNSIKYFFHTKEVAGNFPQEAEWTAANRATE